MGERKGTNKYYPPDYDPRKGGLNKFLGTHALRERARKIHLGIIIVRFEMPYNIWCEGCKNHIGMGVRYNAEKKKIGMYYSTPIYQFRMKCHLCDNHFEIKTDPGNLDYVIISGARRQENRWDPTENEQVVPETKETQKKLFDDAMFKLEHVLKDAKTAQQTKPALEKLFQRNLDVWKDSYEANCKLRADFRMKRKELQKQQEKDNELLSRTSLDIKLCPENEEDRKLAAMMKLRSKSALEKELKTYFDILMKPVLPSSTVTSFIGNKPQKLINKLKTKPLGIKKKYNKNSMYTTTVRRAVICNSTTKTALNGSICNGTATSTLNGTATPAHNSTICNGTTKTAFNATICNGTATPALNGTMCNGTATPAQNSTICNGTTKTALNSTICNGTATPTHNSTICNGTTKTALNSTICNGTATPAHNSTICNSTTKTSLNSTICNGTATPALNGTMCNGTATPALNSTICNGTTTPALNGIICNGTSSNNITNNAICYINNNSKTNENGNIIKNLYNNIEDKQNDKFQEIFSNEPKKISLVEDYSTSDSECN